MALFVPFVIGRSNDFGIGMSFDNLSISSGYG